MENKTSIYELSQALESQRAGACSKKLKAMVEEAPPATMWIVKSIARLAVHESEAARLC